MFDNFKTNTIFDAMYSEKADAWPLVHQIAQSCRSSLYGESDPWLTPVNTTYPALLKELVKNNVLDDRPVLKFQVLHLPQHFEYHLDELKALGYMNLNMMCENGLHSYNVNRIYTKHIRLSFPSATWAPIDLRGQEAEGRNLLAVICSNRFLLLDIQVNWEQFGDLWEYWDLGSSVSDYTPFEQPGWAERKKLGELPNPFFSVPVIVTGQDPESIPISYSG